MIRDLTFEEYQAARRCYIDTPFGPYVDLVNNARLLMPYVEKGTPLSTIMTQWSKGDEELDAEGLEAMIYENEDIGDILAKDLARLKGSKNG